jgi:hypothetical protein
MIFRVQPPSPSLACHVEYFWYHEGLVSDYAMERLVPDGGVASPKRFARRRALGPASASDDLFGSSKHSFVRAVERPDCSNAPSLTPGL